MEPASDLTLEGLTALIAQSSRTISDTITSQKLQPLSFSASGPQAFPIPPQNNQAAYAARLAIIEATELLHRLIIGPQEYVHWIAAAHHDTSTFRTLLRLGVFTAVPLTEEGMSYSSLATQLNTDLPRLIRLLRYAQTNGLFYEPTPSTIAHSSISATLAQDPYLLAIMRHHVEEAYPSACFEADQVMENPGVDGGEANKAGFQKAFGTEKAIFDWLESQPKRAENFAMAMTGLTSEGGIFDGRLLVEQWPWRELEEGTTIVDVGGGSGHISTILATAHPHLNFIVQDKPTLIAQAQRDSHNGHRIHFSAQNFFSPQPGLSNLLTTTTPPLNSANGKGIYFLRLILHDWSNANCVKILRNIVAVMENGGTILINDQVLPPKGAANRHVEKMGRMIDMQMMTMHNSQERSRQDFEDLLAATDPRLKLVGVHLAEPSPLALLEVRLEG